MPASDVHVRRHIRRIRRVPPAVRIARRETKEKDDEPESLRRINWVLPFWIPEGHRPEEFGWKLEKRPIRKLRFLWPTSRSEVREIEASMKADRPIPVPVVKENGRILDGHHRVTAARKLLGKEAEIPVIIDEKGTAPDIGG